MNGSIEPHVVNVADVNPADILIHDETSPNPTLPYLLAQLDLPEFPVPMGVLRAINRPVYGDMLDERITSAQETQGKGDLKKYLRAGETWTV